MLVSITLAAAACSGSSPVDPGGAPGGSGGLAGQGGSAGSGGTAGGDAGGGGAGGGGGTGGEAPCSHPGADLVVLLDDRERLHTFDPRKLGTASAFAELGPLSCPAADEPVPGFPGRVEPYALAVDRRGVASVLYTTGELFHVSLRGAPSCTATAFVPQQEMGRWKLFTLAHAATQAGEETDTLYVAGGGPTSPPGGHLGVLDPATLSIRTVGAMDRVGDFAPWITGMADGRLFAFVPGITDAHVRRIDTTTAKGVGDEAPLPGNLDITSVGFAFAHWGGKLYLFLTSGAPLATRLHRFDPATGYEDVVLEDAGTTFLAAGVSGCAPVSAP